MLTKSKANPTMNKYSWNYLHLENSPGYSKSAFFFFFFFFYFFFLCSVAGKSRIKWFQEVKKEHEVVVREKCIFY